MQGLAQGSLTPVITTALAPDCTMPASWEQTGLKTWVQSTWSNRGHPQGQAAGKMGANDWLPRGSPPPPTAATAAAILLAP